MGLLVPGRGACAHQRQHPARPPPPPPGQDDKYAHFTRIIFDTAPTGHTLRLLALPDFLDTRCESRSSLPRLGSARCTQLTREQRTSARSVGKILLLRQKIASITDSVKGIFTGGAGKDDTSAKLDAFKGAIAPRARCSALARACALLLVAQFTCSPTVACCAESMAQARAVFHDQENTQFIIVTIPTLMAASESIRLAKALRREGVPLRTIVLNQVLSPDVTQQFLDTRAKDQQRAMHCLAEDPELSALQLIKAPLLDLEVRGVPALQYFGDLVYR